MTNNLFSDTNGDTYESRKEYHREKSAEHRNGWEASGCKAATLYVPVDMQMYFRGMAMVMSAQHILQEVANGNEDVIRIMADRRPKYSVTHHDVDVVAAQGEDYKEDADFMLALLRQARLHKALGKERLGFGMSGLYHLAVELGLVYYLKGYFDLTLHKIKGGPLPHVDKPDFDHLKARSPHVG